jgi:hydroxymethylpyrimidine pyrophosphatase-like HAD family hydrolase
MLSQQSYDLNSAQAQKLLAPVTHIYTDLDGTLFAPGGRLLCNNAGEPSTALAEALVCLQKLGIQITIVTGRNREQCVEIMRILNIQDCFGEMGTVIMRKTGPGSAVSYNLGAWDELVNERNPRYATNDYRDQTPYEVVKGSGVVKQLLVAFAGRLEPHNPYSDRHEVTQSLRGNVDVVEANRLLAGEALPLELLDNGIIHPKTTGLDSSITEVHAYHLLPKGASKAQAVAADIAERQLSREQTIAIGDAVGDIEMGNATGALVVVRNALKADTARKAIDTRSANGLPTLITDSYTADGWVEFANALIAAKQERT